MGTEDKTKVREIVPVSLHEIAIHSSDSPRKHNLTACRDELNILIQVPRTPGFMPGSHIIFKPEPSRYNYTYIPKLYSNRSKGSDTYLATKHVLASFQTL